MTRFLTLVLVVGCSSSPTSPGEMPPLAPRPGPAQPQAPKVPPPSTPTGPGPTFPTPGDAGVPLPKTPNPLPPSTAMFGFAATTADAGAVDAAPADAALPPVPDASLPIDAAKPHPE